MRLKIVFGLIDSKEVRWWQSVEDFPKLIKHLGKNFEWVFYDKDISGKVDLILTFVELPSYDPNYGVDCPLWSELFPEEALSCECGAKHTSFPQFHMFLCRLWRKW